MNLEESKNKLLRNIDDFCRSIDDEYRRLNFKRVNIFDILKITNAEIRHSNFLAWLFNSNESHDLGGTVLKLFIQGLKQEQKSKFERLEILDVVDNIEDYKSFKVYTEVEDIDILLVSKKEKFVICIENKLDSVEHPVGNTEQNQTFVYRDRISRMYKREDGYNKPLCIYLSAQGEEPEDISNWIVTDYQIIYDILNNILKEEYKLSYDVRYLIECYVEILKRKYVEDEDIKRICSDIYNKYNDKWEFIQSNINVEDYMCEICNDIKNYLIQKKQEQVEMIKYNSLKTLYFNTEIMREKFDEDILWGISFSDNWVEVFEETDYRNSSDSERNRKQNSWRKFVESKATFGIGVKRKTYSKIYVDEDNLEENKKQIKEMIDEILKEKWEEKF